jgi:FkbM family methyltransferase
MEILDALLDPNDYFLDIGANIGFYSVSMGAKIRAKGKGKVIAFEPFEGNYNRLKHNVELNNLDEYCILYQMGLSNENTDSLITLREDFDGGSNTGNASIVINEEIDGRFEKVPVKLLKLDDFWKKHDYDKGKIGLIKMDIEGHEDFCLEGGASVISEHRPTILMEVNKPYYKARGVVSLDELFLPLIPERYSIYRSNKKQWIQISTLDKCKELDNVFLVPNEKIVLNNFKIFH